MWGWRKFRCQKALFCSCGRVCDNILWFWSRKSAKIIQVRKTDLHFGGRNKKVSHHPRHAPDEWVDECTPWVYWFAESQSLETAGKRLVHYYNSIPMIQTPRSSSISISHQCFFGWSCWGGGRVAFFFCWWWWVLLNNNNRANAMVKLYFDDKILPSIFSND